MQLESLKADTKIEHRPRQLGTIFDVQEGDTVTFKYSDGQEPGTYRTVLVTSNSREHLSGFCLERNNDFRLFLWNKVNRCSIKVVPPFIKKIVTTKFEAVPLQEYMPGLMKAVAK